MDEVLPIALTKPLVIKKQEPIHESVRPMLHAPQPQKVD